MDALFQQAALKPVYWLLKAKEICAAIPIQTRSRCNGAVYAVLLRPADAGDYAVYIGSTGTTNFRGFPDRQSARIAQHFKGGRSAARRVGPRGQEPLWSLNLFFKKVVGSGDYLPALETSVHRELETCVKNVYGDTVD